MEFSKFKKCVAEAANALGIVDYELYYTCGESTELEAFGHEINGFTSSVEGGVSLRCALNGKMGYASTQELSEAEACALVRRAAENAATMESEEPALFVEGGQTYEEHPAPSYPLPDAAQLKKTLLEIQEKLLASDPMVLDNSQSYAASGTESVAIFNSRGLDVSVSAGMASFHVAPIVGNGEEMSNDYEFKLGDPAKIDFDELISKAVTGAKNKLGGIVPGTGAMPVVFAPEAMRSLLGTFSSAFSSEMAQKGLSALKGKEGEMVASPNVTLVDDPFFDGIAMPMPFDAEGSPTHKKNVIEKGKLLTLLYNLQTAAKEGRQTTGNASKSGYASKIGVRPFILYLEPGTESEEELLRKAGSGVYVNMLGGLHAGADPVSGDFSLQSGGFLIENGAKAGPIKSFTVAGNFFDLLRGITAIADNLEPPRGGTTGFCSPSVLVQGLTVAGK